MFNWFKKDKANKDGETSSPESDVSNKIENEASVKEQSSTPAPQNQEAGEQTSVSSAPEKKEEEFGKSDVDSCDEKQTNSDENPSINSSINPASDLPSEDVLVNAIAEDESTTDTHTGEKSEQIKEEQTKEEKQGLFARLKASLSRTKANIGSGFSSLLLGKNIDDELYEELETQLLLADVGMNTTNKIISELTKNAKSSQLKDGEALSKMLQGQMQDILDKVNQPLDFSIATQNNIKHPFVILMVGVNGVGKTTTIGKLAKQFQAQGKSVMLAAGDTFRAAAVEQLEVWGERNDIPVVAQHTGADSASVIFDAIQSAQAKKADVLIADTAGRLQNKDHLIEELKKVVRVMKKLNPNAPHEVMLTLDASTGQNAVSQTKIFNEAVGITGINLTKLDGSAKGGVIFALADEFNIPVRYIGIGEGIDDLKEFDAKTFVEALFAN